MQQLLLLVRDLAAASSPLALVVLVFWLLNRALPVATRPGATPAEAWRCVFVTILFVLTLAAVAVISVLWLR
jgi:hypothetical protein